MPISSSEHKLVYYSVPKNACSSLKRMMYQIKFGKPFDSDENGTSVHGVNRQFGSSLYDKKKHEKHIAKGFFSFCIIRDPIKRYLSAYQNKIGRHIEVGAVDASKNHLFHRHRDIFLMAGLNPEPDINEYLKYLDLYNQVYKTLQGHTRPHFYYLGDDLSRFDRVYKIEELVEMERDVRGRVGMDVTLPHSNQSDRKILFSDLEVESRNKLIELTASDYRYLNEFYSPPDL